MVIRNSLIMVEAKINDFENGVPSTGRDDHTKSRRKRRKKKKKKSGNNSTAGSVDGRSEDDSSYDDAFLSPSKTRNNKNGDANHTTTTAASVMSTPQEIARHRLIEEDGLEANRVDSAMEEMWNKGLPYDDYGAVLSYLMEDISETIEEPNTNFSAPTLVSVSTHKADEEMASATETTELDSDPAHPDSPRMMCTSDDKVTENGDTPIPTEETNGEKNNTDNDTIEKEEEGPDDDDEYEYESVDEYEDESPAAPPATMAEKLDIVAGFENLTDAIFALTQWVNKAAKLEDVEELCMAEKTMALPTVVRRGISSEVEDSTIFESAVQPGLVQLILGVLDRCGVVDEMGESGEEELEVRIESMLMLARRVCLLAESDETNGTSETIANRVSQFVVSRIRIAMEEIKEIRKIRGEKDQAEKYKPPAKIEIQRNGLATNMDKSDKSMVDLMKERDALKLDANMASVTVCRLIDKIMASRDNENGSSSHFENGHSNGTTNGNGHHSISLPSSIPLESETIMQFLVDIQTVNRFDDERAQLETLKANAELPSKSSPIIHTLCESILELESRRQTYKEKIAELRAAIQQLEAEDQEAAAEIEGLSARIEEENVNGTNHGNDLQKEIQAVEESVKYGDLVGSLASMMKSYGKTIEKATSNEEDGSLSSHEASNVVREESSLAPAAMIEFLRKIRDYFLTEAECEAKLRARVEAKTADVASLRSELEQYNSAKGLDTMVNTIRQIEVSIETIENIIKEDTLRIETLLRDGRSMYDDLLTRIEDYNKSIEDSSLDDLNLFPTSILEGVPAAIQSLKIDEDCDRLKKYVGEATEICKPEEDTLGSQDTEGTEKSSRTSASSESAPHQSPSRRVPTPGASIKSPKLAWASPKIAAKSPTGKKPSLLDIQKEQLGQ